MDICFIGGGNMATALIGGMLGKDFVPQQISVVEINAENRTRIWNDFSIQTFENFSEGIAHSQIILLAVKPQQLREVSLQLAPSLRSEQLLISIAAGVRAADLARWIGSQMIVRAMPNTPAMIRNGITGLYALSAVSDTQRDQAQKIMATVGETIWLQDEMMMDAITAISGSGPAYVFYFIEALQQAAQKMGFSNADARRLSVSTFLGASKLAAASNEDVSMLRARVTSKNGTTDSAISSMANNQIAEHIVEAALAAQARSHKIGDEIGDERK